MLHEQGIGVRFPLGVEEVLISRRTISWILKIATKWRWDGKSNAAVFTIASRLTMGPTESPTQWVVDVFFTLGKAAGG